MIDGKPIFPEELVFTAFWNSERILGSREFQLLAQVFEMRLIVF